jgi:hypothetical protein
MPVSGHDPIFFRLPALQRTRTEPRERFRIDGDSRGESHHGTLVFPPPWTRENFTGRAMCALTNPATSRFIGATSAARKIAFNFPPECTAL